MEHRRLTLVRGEQPSAVAFRGNAVPLPPGSLALTDTDTGALSVRFCLMLATELAAQGVRLPVLFTAFEGTPGLESELAAQFAACTEQLLCRAMGADEQAALALRTELGAAAPGRAWLVVGQPALVAFAAPLRILVRGERPPQAWSPGLRTASARVSLELWSLRPGVAKQLATYLRLR